MVSDRISWDIPCRVTSWPAKTLMGRKEKAANTSVFEEELSESADLHLIPPQKYSSGHVTFYFSCFLVSCPLMLSCCCWRINVSTGTCVCALDTQPFCSPNLRLCCFFMRNSRDIAGGCPCSLEINLLRYKLCSVNENLTRNHHWLFSTYLVEQWVIVSTALVFMWKVSQSCEQRLKGGSRLLQSDYFTNQDRMFYWRV